MELAHRGRQASPTNTRPEVRPAHFLQEKHKLEMGAELRQFGQLNNTVASLKTAALTY